MKVRAECGGKGETTIDGRFPVSQASLLSPRSVTPSAAAFREERKPEPKASQPKPSEPETVYEAGMTLRHPTFGEGTITAVSGKGMSRILDVEFPTVGTKRLGVAWVEKKCRVE